MRLSRKKAIALCIELWEWLALTGKKKWDWPEWEKYSNDIVNACWFCHYQEQQDGRYTSTSSYNKDGQCRYCPLSSIGTSCQDTDSFYDKWEDAKTPRTRKKYAKLFLEQIKSIEGSKRE